MVRRLPTVLAALTLALALPALAAPTTAAGPHAADAAAARLVPGGLFRPAPDAGNRNDVKAGNTVLTYSTNWSGYAVIGGTFTTATATWVQNAITCTNRRDDTDMSPWVGLDGFNDNTVEQTGTSGDCNGTSKDYYAWYEFYPANFVTINKTVDPGDTFTGTVTNTSGKSYSLKLTDDTQGWSFSTTGTESATDASAEAVMEEAANYLTQWSGTDPFTSFTVNGQPVGGFTASQYTIEQMEIQDGSTLCDSTSSLSANENFTVGWLNLC
ncbi:MAG TPA: G1 family glutamic endopeptidase [Actinocrinis sp.]|jgi:hypothetical protein